MFADTDAIRDRGADRRHGTMADAGDPVQVSPVRTTNAEWGFHGFFRPTG
ncbi:hypothetical protein [Mycobacterium sp.]